MAKANAILLNSILWNLREITNLAEKIKERCGDVECASWRYPLTSCNRLEVFKLIENNRSLDSYTYVLELTYDRLLYVFNLLIKFLESTDSSGKFRPDKNVVRPKTLSLASMLHMMWDRIENRAVSFSSTEADEPGKNAAVCHSKSSACTQSEVCSLSICSSCGMVQEFVTQIVLAAERILEKQGFASAIAEERIAMKEHLGEMSNGSAMSRWLAAIAKDFEAVAQRAEEATATSQKFRRRLDSGEQEMKTKSDHFEEEIRKLNALIEGRDVDIIQMKKQINKLTEEKEKGVRDANAKNEDMGKTILTLEEKILVVKKSYGEKLSKLKRKNAEKSKEWKEKVEEEGRRRRESEQETERLRRLVGSAEHDLARSRSENSHLLTRIEQLEAANQLFQRRNSNLNATLAAKEKLVEDLSSRIMEAFPDLNGPSLKSRYKASGNPRIDMENQVEANKLRIELLKSENENFIKTLEKLKTMEI